MKTVIISIFVLFAALAATAQEPVVITLEQARSMAVQNNAKVKVARNNTLAATEQRREAFTAYFPTISAQAMGFRSNKYVLYHNFDDIFSLGLIKKGASASLTAIQPVFAGGRIVNTNKLASVGEQAGQLEEQRAADDVRLTAEQYYWQVVTLKTKKHTLESVISMVDTLERQVSAAVNAGVVLPNELLKVQIKRNDLRTLMVDLDNGINLSNQLLAQYIGMDGTAIDVAAEQVPEDMPPYPGDVFVEPESALPGTTDYRLLDKQVEAADLQTRLAVGENLPVVGIGAGLIYDDLLNEKYSFGAAFISVTVPISQWWGGSHAIKRARLQAENARTTRDNLGEMLRLNMSNTWDDLTAAYRKMQIAHESIAQSTENLRLNENYYNAGVATVTELLDAQTLYRQSQDQYTEAYSNFRMARAKYLNATGRSDMQ